MLTRNTFYFFSVDSFSESIQKFSGKLKFFPADFSSMSRMDCSKLCLRFFPLLDRETTNVPLSRIENEQVFNFRLLLQMIKPFSRDFCVESVFRHCDQACGKNVHLPPYVPSYDKHIHLNEASSADRNDLLSIRTDSFCRDIHFIENKHKPSQ